MKTLTLAATFGLLAAPAFAESHSMAPAGDAAAGEEQFNRQCVTCHVVVDDDDNLIAGRNPNVNTGPNLYGVAGRTIGSVEGFRYSESLMEVGAEDGLGQAWNEEHFVGYVQDPTGWLREVLDDRRARGKMAYQVRSEDDAADLYAYLYSVAPPAMEEEMEGEGDS